MSRIQTISSKPSRGQSLSSDSMEPGDLDWFGNFIQKLTVGVSNTKVNKKEMKDNAFRPVAWTKQKMFGDPIQFTIIFF